MRRTIRWTTKGIEWEYNRKQIFRILQFAGLAHGSRVTTPLVRERPEDGHDMYGEDTDPDVVPGEVTGYRSCSMTVAYVAQDRTDLQGTVRGSAKGLSQPMQRSMRRILSNCSGISRSLTHWTRIPIWITQVVFAPESRRPGLSSCLVSTRAGAYAEAKV